MRVQEFTEGFQYQYGDRLHFSAESFKKWQDTIFPGTSNGEYRTEIGNGYVLDTKCLPKIYSFSRGLDMPRGGVVKFDDDVHIIRLTQKFHLWMSLTPMEVYTQRSGVRRAKGRVLICGLGMGWMARRVLDREKVTSVTIVERDEHVLNYFGGLLVNDFGSKVRLIHGDAYEIGNPGHPEYNYDMALWDIWESPDGHKYDETYKGYRFKAPTWHWGWKK